MELRLLLAVMGDEITAQVVSVVLALAIALLACRNSACGRRALVLECCSHL